MQNLWCNTALREINTPLAKLSKMAKCTPCTSMQHQHVLHTRAQACSLPPCGVRPLNQPQSVHGGAGTTPFKGSTGVNMYAMLQEVVFNFMNFSSCSLIPTDNGEKSTDGKEKSTFTQQSIFLQSVM